MRSTFRTAFLASLALLVLGSARTLEAGMVSGPFSDSIGQQTTDFSTPLTLPKFDTSLGTLTQVTLDFATSGNASGSVLNTAAQAQSFRLTEDILVTLSLNGNALLDTTLSSSQTYSGLASGGTAAFGPFAPTANAPTATFTSGPLFDLFDGGPGSVVFDVSTLTGQSFLGGGGNITASIATTAGATATVTYTYEPTAAVPEPDSIALVLAGSVALGLSTLARRRKARLHAATA